MPWAVQCSCFRVTTCPLWWLLVALEGRDEPLESVTISQAVAAGHGIVLIFPAWANRKGSGWMETFLNIDWSNEMLILNSLSSPS